MNFKIHLGFIKTQTNYKKQIITKNKNNSLKSYLFDDEFWEQYHISERT